MVAILSTGRWVKIAPVSELKVTAQERESLWLTGEKHVYQQVTKPQHIYFVSGFYQSSNP